MHTALFRKFSGMTPLTSGNIGSENVANNSQGQLKIWGRANSVNVQKVLWCLRELDLS